MERRGAVWDIETLAVSGMVGLGKALEPVDDGDQDVVEATRLELV
jgi:hypothetical protein